MLRLYVIFVALTSAACSSGEVKKLDKIRAEVCACKTAKCAESALDRVPKDNIESTPKAQQIARAMLDCYASILEADRPTQDPDAPTAPEPSEPTSARRP